MAHFVAKQEWPHITESLRKVLEKLPDYEQDRIAQHFLALIAKDEEDWDAAFSHSKEKLEKLRNDALKAFLSGETQPLDPEKL